MTHAPGVDERAVRRFDDAWREEVQLADGTPVVLRFVRATDKPLLTRGFARMSPRSRYLRFFTPKTRLSNAELRYFTEVDGVDHVAIGAVAQRGGEAEEGVGVARFVRLSDEPEVAEAAIAVVDDWHGRGVGTLLLKRLAAAASERGVRHFRCDVLAENDPMKRLLADVGADATFHQMADGVVRVDMSLPPAEPARALRDTALHRVLSHAARQAVRVVPRLRGDAGGDDDEGGEGLDDGA